MTDVRRQIPQVHVPGTADLVAHVFKGEDPSDTLAGTCDLGADWINSFTSSRTSMFGNVAPDPFEGTHWLRAGSEAIGHAVLGKPPPGSPAGDPVSLFYVHGMTLQAYWNNAIGDIEITVSGPTLADVARFTIPSQATGSWIEFIFDEGEFVVVSGAPVLANVIRVEVESPNFGVLGVGAKIVIDDWRGLDVEVAAEVRGNTTSVRGSTLPVAEARSPGAAASTSRAVTAADVRRAVPVVRGAEIAFPAIGAPVRPAVDVRRPIAVVGGTALPAAIVRRRSTTVRQEE